MSLIAGIDIGNATTEVVIVDTSAMPPRALAFDRAPTRGRKGSDGSVRAALALLHRLERRSGITADVLAMAPQFPVDTRGARVAAPLPDTGRLAVLGSGRSTPAGRGVGVGRPLRSTPNHKAERSCWWPATPWDTNTRPREYARGGPREPTWSASCSRATKRYS